MATPPATQAPPFPGRGWGHPACFWWVPQHGAFYCRLCWRYVDDKHLGSHLHMQRAQSGESSTRLQYRSPVEKAGLDLVGFTIDEGRIRYRVPFACGTPWADVVYRF